MEFLAGLAGDGRVLELAIGTGRAATRSRSPWATQMITLDGQGMHLRPVAIRYSYPAEPDLMAGSAGLRLAGRYAGWDRRPFTSASDGHISVYQRA